MFQTERKFKKKSSSRSSKRRSTRRRVTTMPKKKKYSRKRSSGMGSVKNMVKLAGGGLLAGAVISKFVPQVPYANVVGGFLIGGLPGAVGAFVAPMALGAVGGNGASSSGAW